MSKIVEGHEGVVAIGNRLAESWSQMPRENLARFGYGSYVEEKIDFLEGVQDPIKRATMAIVLENTFKALAKSPSLLEDSTSGNVATFPKYIFPLIKAMMANDPTDQLFSVQPMTGPVGMVYYFDIVTGKTKGATVRGTKAFDSQGGPQTGEQDYASEKITSETIATAGGGENHYTGNLSWIPLRAGSIQIVAGSQTLQDNGNGAFVGNGTGTVNLTTGAIDVTFTSNVDADTLILADYEFNSETSDTQPDLDFLITGSSMTAIPFRLRTRWSMDSEQDLKELYGENAEALVTEYTGNEIKKEIYNRLVRQVRTISPGGYVEWRTAAPIGVSDVEHRNSLPLKVTEANNQIFDRTQRFGGDWLVAGTQFATYIESLPEQYFKRAGKPTGAGVHKVGTLSTGHDVWKDPAYPTTEAVIGHKGTNPLDTGIIYAVYIGLYSTETYRMDDFKARKGLATRAAIKVVNNKYYQKMRLV